jgi:hypothetical protein
MQAFAVNSIVQKINSRAGGFDPERDGCRGRVLEVFASLADDPAASPYGYTVKFEGTEFPRFIAGKRVELLEAGPARCSVCGWPVCETTAEGCTAVSCSMRPA